MLPVHTVLEILNCAILLSKSRNHFKLRKDLQYLLVNNPIVSQLCQIHMYKRQPEKSIKQTHKKSIPGEQVLVNRKLLIPIGAKNPCLNQNLPKTRPVKPPTPSQ